MDNVYRKYFSVIAGMMLLLAIPSMWPYGYYQLLRWIVSLTVIFNAYGTYKLNSRGWTVVMIIVAIIFNPIAPLALTKGMWILIDLATAFCMFVIVSEFKEEIA